MWLSSGDKQLVEHMAHGDERPVSNFIAWLIRKEARRRKLIEKEER